ncbi:D-arabinono-1,4-lactone oxidase [Phormidesmis priestleyi]|uniref:D-arabinono-1,4-lactone oxidase n=1 Tax=Phormidesmis priestleyi TaxID=268141 RepID=UPI0015E6BE8D|nr:D-arabinono-1,4-lactone oxidase [Phormidesmis priestleyi]
MDGDRLEQEPLSKTATAEILGGSKYRRVKCFNKSNGTFVGYLSSRNSQSTALGIGEHYPPSECYWMEKGEWQYLAQKTSPNDRCLGISDSWYACWSLQQSGKSSGYYTNVIHNADGTISPGNYPDRFLTGPYRSLGIDWVWWAEANDPDILVCELELATAPTWVNWSGNIKHVPALDNGTYYYTPKNHAELTTMLAEARRKGATTIRVSGQRHSQPPLVADDNRKAPPKTTTTYIVDMSCYVDVGDQGMVMGPGPNQVTVKPGIREDALDAFLSKNNKMMKTVTAGGFFSIGGMTAVDVHGGTVDGPILAETASSFTIMNADGKEQTIDANSPSVNGWSPLQFARVSLGGLGIVTKIVLDVLPRPYATTLKGEVKNYLCEDKAAFISTFKKMLTGPSKHDRMEVFYTPYAAAPNLPFPVSLENFLVLSWDIVNNPAEKIPNESVTPQTACALAGSDEFGAPYVSGIKDFALPSVRASQYYPNAYDPFHTPPIPPSGFVKIAMDVIESQANTANQVHSDLWLVESAQVIFMSYFIELPDLDEKGLAKVWDGLAVVGNQTIEQDAFHIAAPLEFRFVKSGNTAMSGSYSTKPTYFINLDLIGWIEPSPAAEYPTKLLQFFADVERDWVAMGGLPHNGKMYGFYDPHQPTGTHSAPFNRNFLSMLRKLRGERLTAFNAFRKALDPSNLFYNDFLRQLLEA